VVFSVASFRGAVRNGVLHADETREGWLIWQGWGGGPLVEAQPDGRVVLYCDAFHAGVKKCLAEYFMKLRRRDHPKSTELRRMFIDRVSVLYARSKPKT
jgi:hypothetical protein